MLPIKCPTVESHEDGPVNPLEYEIWEKNIIHISNNNLTKSEQKQNTVWSEPLNRVVNNCVPLRLSVMRLPRNGDVKVIRGVILTSSADMSTVSLPCEACDCSIPSAHPARRDPKTTADLC